MLHTELHSLQGLKSTANFGSVSPAQPSDADMEILTREMENMVVEQQMRNEAPIQALWTAAVEQGRELFQRARKAKQRPAPLQRVSSLSPVKGGLPSPPGGSVSPELPPVVLPNGHSVIDVDGEGHHEGADVGRRLPSPRLSPPPVPSR